MGFNGITDQGHQVLRMACSNGVYQPHAHARFPKFVDMGGNAVYGFLAIRISRKKLTNLIGHGDKVF